MDDFLVTWLYSAGFILVSYIGIMIAAKFSKKKAESEDREKTQQMHWLKTIMILFVLSVVIACVISLTSKLDAFGLIILIGIPGALISMLGKK